MDIKIEIQNYRNIVADIKRLENEIEQRKLELIPSCTQTLSDMPSGHNTDSIIERVVIDIERDSTLYRLSINKANLERIREIVDIELFRLTTIEREYMKYYTEGISIQDIQAILHSNYKIINEYKTVQNKIYELKDLVIQNHYDFMRKYKIGQKSGKIQGLQV